nr:DUF2637 domain-containing protein [Streptomyces aurantiogriseus]
MQPLTRTQKILTGIVVGSVLIIATLGFIGSYSAVTELALTKGFGRFAHAFPLAVDAGIIAFLALDLLLTWRRIPFPLLRQTAWGLTAATIAFNAATAWPDRLGVGMHATIPVLFVIAVEAARHAIGRIADITADRHLEGIRWTRWLLAFPSTFRLWRRRTLWELRSYDEALRMEQQRLVYRARLRATYGRAWRWRAPVEAVLPLRLARFGLPVGAPVPVDEGAPKALPPVVVEAPQSAPDAEVPAAVEAPSAPAPERPKPSAESAPEAPPAVAPERPESAPTPKAKAPRKAPSKRPGKVTRTDAKTALKALYGALSRRPLEGELIDELKRIGYLHTSRQHANKLRSEIEADEPQLAALGSDNVRALTGTEG